jgi:hypothetical protein
VRIREGRQGREVLGFNLYLSPNDVWTGAIVPTEEGGRLITADTTCTDPPFNDGGLDFRNDKYTGVQADDAGDGLDRTREGYVEMLEMATLTGGSREAVFHTNAGIVPGCATMRAMVAPTVAAPIGGLWGTLTLINVNSGQDFTLDATALADLARQPYFRLPSDPYPDFSAAEIDPVSSVLAHGQLYRSVWSRPIDAVSAVLMRGAWSAEYVVDPGTASETDIVTTMPTRHHYVTASSWEPPFSKPNRWSVGCLFDGEWLSVVAHNREERAFPVEGHGFAGTGDTFLGICSATAVGSVRADFATLPASRMMGSQALGYLNGRIAPIGDNGWHLFRPRLQGVLTSLPSSTRHDLGTGATVPGPHAYVGLPLIGFAARTFTNGTLQCAGSGSCQGNYGGAFAFRYRPAVSPP